MGTELHVYDFDGTLFRSPDRPDWWGKGYWITHPASLDVPCVPEKPGNNYWIGKTVSSAKQSIGNPDVLAIMVTGRLDNSFARWRVPELLKQKGLNFDSVHLATGGDTAAFKMSVIRPLVLRHHVDAVHIWEDDTEKLAKYIKMVEGMGVRAVPHVVRERRMPATCSEFDTRSSSLTQQFREARRPTDESKQYKLDEKNRQNHIKAAKRAFKLLLADLKPIADEAVQAFPGRDKQSLQRRGRFFSKHAKGSASLLSYLDQWIGSEAQHPKAYSWRNALLYQARDVLLYGKKQRDALIEVEKQAFKGFQAITMAEAQAPYRDVVPAPLREYLPTNIVVEVDARGSISRVTDRFENEHLTLGKKIDKMKSLVKRYNIIAKRVKRDLKNRDEIIRLSALITAIIMETGIRPGKMGNGKVKTINGEDVMVETFGAITLGPSHVNFVRANFAKLEFVGKMTSVNTAEIADGAIIKVLKEYVDKALKQGTKYIFVTNDGQQFSYSDLQRYFRENFDGLSPTDFRKLRATEVVLAALRDEQAALYLRIREFAGTAKDDLKERIVEAIVDTFEAAIAKSQAALSHDSAATTVRSYINPEVVLRFLSTGRVDDSLEAAILTGETKLAFDPQTFMQAAGVKMARTRVATSLGDLLVELKEDLEDAGVRKVAFAASRLAARYVKAVGTEQDIQQHLRPFAAAYTEFVKAVNDGQSRGLGGDSFMVRKWANPPWVALMDNGFKIAEGILGTRAIPARKAKGLEMAYRLFYRSRNMPKDVYKWWAKNQKRLDLIIEAASKWPPKEEGGDELFKVGPFTVHNTVGLSGAPLESFKKMLEVAIAKVKRNAVPGFQRVLYGDIYLVGQITQAHHAAWYNRKEDVVYCRLAKKAWRMDEAQTLVHEFGHRYWYKFADKQAKTQWEMHHERLQYKSVEVKLPELGDELPVRIKGAPRGWRPTLESIKADTYWYRTPEGSLSGIAARRLRTFYNKTQGAELRFPTAYSAKNNEEHFCDALSLMSFGALPADHAVPFKSIWT